MSNTNYPTPYKDHYPQGVEWDAMMDVKPVYRILNDAVTAFPERVAIDFMGHEMTYNEVKTEVNKIAKGLFELGVEKGKQVGLLLPNTPHTIIAHYAVLRTGATVVNLSPLCSKDELKAKITQAKISHIITLDLKACYGQVAELIAGGMLTHVVVGSLKDYLPPLTRTLFSLFKRSAVARVPNNEVHVPWSRLLTSDDVEFEAKQVDPHEDVAVLQFTGGTTGTPKAAMLTHANIYSNVMQSVIWCQGIEGGKERMLAVLPFFHVFAMTVVMHLGIAKGATLILHPRFELEKVIKGIQAKRPTLMPGVPTMFNAILNHPKLSKYDLTSLKLCVSGGAPLPLEVKEGFEAKTGCALVEGYGLTEASPVVAFNPPFGKQKSGTIGQPMPHTDVLIEDMENRGTFLGVGEEGELCVKGPQVMLGYFEKPDETAECLKDGILRTGDVAKMDEEGYITIVDRLKQMIITGGFNVYPRNVEEALFTHEAVQEAAVIGVDDKHMGQIVKAFVVVKKGVDVNEADLMAFCKEKLAKYEAPKLIEFRDELPKTMIGKVDKKQLG